MASPTLLLDVLCHLCQNLRRQHVCKIGCFVGSVPVLHTFLSRCTARNHAHTRTDKTCTSTPAHTNTHTQRERERERERERRAHPYTRTHTGRRLVHTGGCISASNHACCRCLFVSRMCPALTRPACGVIPSFQWPPGSQYNMIYRKCACTHSPCLWSYPNF